MSQTTDAWKELYAAQGEAIGFDLYAIVNGLSVQAICSELTMDEVFAVGGTAQDGGYKLQTLASNFPADADLKFAEVEVWNQTGLQVLNSNFNNGVFYLVAGDFVSKE